MLPIVYFDVHVVRCCYIQSVKGLKGVHFFGELGRASSDKVSVLSQYLNV